MDSYTDEEYRLILSHPPTKASAALLAPILGRSVEAIEWEYRILYMRFGEVPNTRTKRIRKLARELGWIAVLKPD